MPTLNQILIIGQEIAAEIALAARKDIDAIALAEDCGIYHHIDRLTTSAIQNQRMSAMHYDKVRYYLEIHD